MAVQAAPPPAIKAGKRKQAQHATWRQRGVAWVIVGATLLAAVSLRPQLREETRSIARRSIGVLEEEDAGGNLLRIPYEKWYEACPPTLRPLYIAFLVLVLVFLFCSISITASDFFCPNLASMASYMGLSETTAGVTLLAFGNGSPDVFSTFAAMREGTFGLAVGELIGAASFITSIVVGSIAMVGEFHVPRFAFLRDASFFTVAVLCLMLVLADGRLTVRESGMMVALYVMYVAVVVGGNWYQRRKRKQAEYAELGWKSGHVDEEQVAEHPESQLVPNVDPSPHLTPPFLHSGRRLSSSTSMQGFALPDAHHHMEEDKRDPGTPRAGFSLLGAVEFRDVVNALRKEQHFTPTSSNASPLPTSSPPHSPADAELDYFAHHLRHHRRSSSQGLAVIEPALARRASGRHRSGSLHPAWSSRPSRQGTDPENPPHILDPVPASPDPSPPDTLAETMPMSPLSRSPAPRPAQLRIDVPSRPDLGVAAVAGPPSPIPHIALHDDMGQEGSPIMPLSRRNTIEITANRWLLTAHRVIHTLFPSLQEFRRKSIVGMALAVLSVPAIFMLTLTLPVIDDGRGDEGEVALPVEEDEAMDDHRGRDREENARISREIGEGLHHLVDGHQHQHLHSPHLHSPHPGHHRMNSSTIVRSGASTPGGLSDDDDATIRSEESDCDTLAFSRPLTAAQCIVGPMTCVWLVFQDDERFYYILGATAIAGVLAAAAVLNYATDGSSQPWRVVRCCAGFLCSMVWIGSIADEVVSVLTTSGEILGLSNAIVGLTVFAVGNSLADLVANVTIAQFSPNMAYAACFGGPMLNLLLGIGGSGTYSILANPQRGPVTLDFSPTLWVSAIGLIAILVATSIVVPLNKYKIDRRWAVCLFCAYVALMTVNVVVEIRSERKGRGK